MNKKIRILLVEDEVLIGMFVASQLKKLGYTVLQQATTGEKAIQSAKENSPDIIVMDIRLAGEMDGIDAAAAIQSESDIPIIFVTGYDDKATKERAAKLHPRGFLDKPLEIGKLKSTIEACFY